MPIQQYSVLKGHPTAGKVVAGASAHYQITIGAQGSSFTVAVNIESVDGSEVLYAIEQAFTAPDPAGLAALKNGMTRLVSAPGGLALDFVRETVAGRPMVTRAEMQLLPIAQSKALFLRDALTPDARRAKPDAHALQNAVVQLLHESVIDPDSLIYAFGSAFADGGVVDGIHDIHMNQGNPTNNHGADNGIWQDGALFISLPSKQTWTALFIAFQTESWTTDEAGNPLAQKSLQ